MKVCRLADQNKDEDDLPEPQDAPQAHDLDSNSGSHSTKDMTGMGFDPNNYSPIPPVWNAALQQGAALRTSMPKPVGKPTSTYLTQLTTEVGQILSIHSLTTQKQIEIQKMSSKGGKVKCSQAKSQSQPSTSTQVPTGTQVGHRYDVPPVEVQTT